MIDIFMVKLGFLGSSIPSTWQLPGLGLASTCWALCCPRGHAKGWAAPQLLTWAHSWVQAPTEALHSTLSLSLSPLHTSVPQAG